MELLVAVNRGCCLFSQKAVSSICTQEDCIDSSLLCDSKQCDCWAAHRNHQIADLDVLTQTLTVQNYLFEGYFRACEAVQQLLGMGIHKFEEIRRKYKIAIGEPLASLKKQDELRRRLIARSPDTVVTGHAIWELMRAVSQTKESTNRLKGLTDLLLRATSRYEGRFPFNDEGAMSVAKGFPQLIKLSVRNTQQKSGHSQITDKGVKAIAVGLPLLEGLTIGANELTDESAKAIAPALLFLKILDISGNYLTDEGARRIAKGLPQLSQFSIASNRVADEGAMAISHGLQMLTTLEIQLNMLTAEGAKCIISHGSRLLTFMDIRNNLNLRAKDLLKQTLPNTRLYM